MGDFSIRCAHATIIGRGEILDNIFSPVPTQLSSDATVCGRCYTRKPPYKFSSKLEFARRLTVLQPAAAGITSRCRNWKLTDYQFFSLLLATNGQQIVDIQQLN